MALDNFGGSIEDYEGMKMTVRSKEQGHGIIYKDKKWQHEVGVDKFRCKHCKEKVVQVDIKGKKVPVDACLAPVIQALNDIGLETECCCCGHGSGHSYIQFKKKSIENIYLARSITIGFNATKKV